MREITNSKDAYEVVREFIKHPTQEEVFIITLDNRNNVLACHFVALGSDTSSVIPKKEICRLALLDVACSVVLIHTHPHGDPRPSSADIERTKELRTALYALDMSLTDHIIIGDEMFYAFADDCLTEV